MAEPAVSVLMAVRDGLPWVREAVASVLTQTLAALELVVVDDGSTDGTGEWLEGVADARLRLARQSPAGLTAALARASALARAPLLARLDADDAALPARLELQRVFLGAHPEVGLLGTAAREVDADGHELRTVRPPAEDAALRHLLVRLNPFVHSSVMMRRGALDEAGGYGSAPPVAQDYDLWMRMSRVTRLACLSEVLVVRRLLPGRVGARRDGDRLRTEARVRWRAVRDGQYPWWCAVFALRPALALALPPAVRRAVRRAVGA